MRGAHLKRRKATTSRPRPASRGAHARRQKVARNRKIALVGIAAVALVVFILVACTSQQEPTEKQASIPGDIAAKTTEVSADGSVAAKSKSELVQATVTSAGTIDRIVDRITLSPADKTNTIQDHTTLANIENIDGVESFNKNGSYLYWENLGKDIVYEGTGNDALPVEIAIKYTLDGREISLSDLEGKSGHVTMCVTFKNTTSGSNFVPYVAATLIVLDTEHFSNVTTNGHMSDMGYRTVIYGVAWPGLEAELTAAAGTSINLGTTNCFEMEADVTNYQVERMETAVTSGYLAKMDTETLKSVSSMGDLSAQIQEQSSSILSSMSSVASSMSTLTEGSSALAEKTSELSEGMAKVVAGTNDLTAGLDALAAESSELVDGSKEFSVYLDQCEEGALTLSEGLGELRDKSSAFPEAAQTLIKVSDTADKIIEWLRSISVRAQCLDKAADNSNTVGDTVTAQELLELKAELLSANSASGSKETLLDLLQELSDQIREYGDNIQAYYDAVDAAATGSSQLSSGLTELSDAYTKLDNGINQAANSINTIDEGAKSLSTGVEQLGSGTSVLAQAQTALNDGISMIASKATSFASSIQKQISSLTGGSSGEAAQLSAVTKRLIEMQAIDAQRHPYDTVVSGTEGTTTYLFTYN